MNVYVFTGPTLSVAEARAELDAVYLPPVSQGDVYRVACRRPWAIGIIDGCFECVPAVWHKEILWAMKEGVHVFGSASMGALRAAELAPFGMEGVGRIFEAYRDGSLEDDDEVAVAHGPAERGSRPTSAAMVDIRATLGAAEAHRVVTRATRRSLERIAKELFYAERNFQVILRRAATCGLPQRQLSALEDWLPQGKVHQKREDALAMLRCIRARQSNPERKMVRYSFEHTEVWERARRQAGSLPRGSQDDSEALRLDRLLDELRLEKNCFARARQDALLRFLAFEEADRQGFVPASEAVAEATEEFRREHGLHDAESLERWLDENHLDGEEFHRWMADEVRLRWVEDLAELEVSAHLLDHLRKTGRLSGLAARALDKDRRLRRMGLHNPGVTDTGKSQEELLRWYFEGRLGEPVPEDVADFARRAGFENEDAFLLALVRECCYSENASWRPDPGS